MQNSLPECKASSADAVANGKPFLLPQHLDDLRRSGLSDAQIEACGFRSVTDPQRIADLLGWKNPALDLGSCLLIPFPADAGTATNYSRLKPDRPRQKDGKPVKYESPVGQPNRVYVPPRTRRALADLAAPVLITEGEKKAAKADQEGFACLGLVGVYGWQQKRQKNANGKPQGERQLIADLETIPWSGRLVYLVFDSDAAEKPEVQWAEYHLAQALTDKGALVKVVRLPPGPTGVDGKPSKVGLDDYLLTNGAAAFRELLAHAVEGAEPEARVRYSPE